MFQVRERSGRLAFIAHQLLLLCWLQASVCMVRPEDAQSLACSAELLIRQQKLSASVVKVPLRIHKNVWNVILYVQLSVLLLLHRNLKGNQLQILPTGRSR